MSAPAQSIHTVNRRPHRAEALNVLLSTLSSSSQPANDLDLQRQLQAMWAGFLEIKTVDLEWKLFTELPSFSCEDEGLSEGKNPSRFRIG
jgi:hypothetical protein